MSFDLDENSNEKNDQDLAWSLKEFNDLSPKELYSILRLRSEIFVCEQNCPFQDMDNIDQHCAHLMCWKNEDLVAYARIVPPGICYEGFPSIGRVITSMLVRRKGVGKELLRKAIIETEKRYKNLSIRIGAQFYLLKFYGSFGFEQTSDVYLLDGIEHIEMTRSFQFKN